MQADRLFAIENKLEVVFTGKKFILPIEVQNKVDEYWDSLIKNKNPLFRGEVFTISDIKEETESITICVDISDYAHYLYSRKIGLPEKYACKNLHTSCLIETSDGMFVFGRMSKDTALPGNIQCVGGGLDNDDIQGKVIDLVHNIKNELMEEAGINADEGKLVNEFRIKYLRQDSSVFSIAAIFILKLNITSQELGELYVKFENQLKSDGALLEFEELVFLDKNKSKVSEFCKKEKPYLDFYMASLLEAEAA